MTRYMVIETFKSGALDAIYDRLHTKGRGLPDGLFFIESWLAADGSKCFQTMETEDYATFEAWMFDATIRRSNSPSSTRVSARPP